MPSEIRDSQIEKLLKKVSTQDYGTYLFKATIHKIRAFENQTITFNFPVTALIGANGSGKSSILGVAGCAYKSIKPGQFFPKSAIGDNSMLDWKVVYELVDKGIAKKNIFQRTSSFRRAKWVRGDVVDRKTRFFGIERTVPAGEKARYKKLKSSTYSHKSSYEKLPEDVAKHVAHILGKNVDDFQVASVGKDDDFLIGKLRETQYSEFHFGAGESSIIRMVSVIENMPKNSLILIEEIENGLHPAATEKMVEYLIDVATRKSIQSIFTTHSDYALNPLPDEAIWACFDGILKQGKISIGYLRVILGNRNSVYPLFVEDEFAKCWVKCILKKNIDLFNQIEVYLIGGDTRAIKMHKNHNEDPSVKFKSICVIDGDSKQKIDSDDRIIRLPHSDDSLAPEKEVVEGVLKNDKNDLEELGRLCHSMNPAIFKQAIERVKNKNRDHHLVFKQIGEEIGVEEGVVRSAFLTRWVELNQESCEKFITRVRDWIFA